MTPVAIPSLASLGGSSEFAAAYLGDAATMSYAALVRSQRGPWPSLAFGAAGMAYALWRATGGDRRRRLDAAERILREAEEAAPGDYWPTDFGARDLRSSLYYGPAGIGYLRILVAHARNDEVTYEQELFKYIARCGATAGSEDELLLGVAGLLNGVRILHHHTGDARLHPIAQTLSEGLLHRATSSEGAWMSTSQCGFGHGAGGILHALLSWSHEAGIEPSPTVLGALAQLAGVTDERRPEVRASVPIGLQRSWCNGTTGQVLLWAKAYESTLDGRHLELARANALTTFFHTSTAGGDLCCGLAGRAYACLAMDRIEPDRGWHERAAQFAERAVLALRRRGTSWNNGLFKGSPGLVCLVHDLASDRRERGGFPLVEG